jgi:Protein of unknown function (DUF433)
MGWGREPPAPFAVKLWLWYLTLYEVTDLENLLDRITVNPNQRGGRPCIREMRIRVTDVLQYAVRRLDHPTLAHRLGCPNLPSSLDDAQLPPTQTQSLDTSLRGKSRNALRDDIMRGQRVHAGIC